MRKGGESVSGPFSAGTNPLIAILGSRATCSARSLHIRSQLNTGTIPPVEMHNNIIGDFATAGKSSVSIVVKVEPYLKRERETEGE